jgi:hypothetical protein
MPLTIGLRFSSAEKGHRLFEAARFSLVMLTTAGMARSIASTSGVLREAASAQAVGRSPGVPAEVPTVATTSQNIQRRVIQGKSTLVVLSAGPRFAGPPVRPDAIVVV